ncbi:MAG: type II toxin-antitoxin system VapC family toxin [Bryobacteraceae bacterium]
MTAVDTNVLVRLLTGDDPSQEAIARSVFTAGQIWISKTVLLETAWVLKSLFDFDDGAIQIALTGLLGLSGVEVEDETAVSAALALTVQGVDFADAMHLASRPHGCHFVTFDRTFARRAKRAGVVSIAVLS